MSAELTDEELAYCRGMREEDFPIWVKLLRAYESLMARVATLTALTEDEHAPNTLEWRQMVDELREQLAARNHDFNTTIQQLQSTLTKAEARVRELEADQTTKLQLSLQLQSAESALASAQSRIMDLEAVLRRECFANSDAVMAVLSAHPDPEPVAECKQCGDPLDDEHPKGPCVPCYERPEAGTRGFHVVAPVAAPCPGCAEWKLASEAELTVREKLRDDVDRFKQAIDAAMAELISPPEHDTQYRVDRALTILRSARKGGGA